METNGGRFRSLVLRSVQYRISLPDDFRNSVVWKRFLLMSSVPALLWNGLPMASYSLGRPQSPHISVAMNIDVRLSVSVSMAGVTQKETLRLQSIGFSEHRWVMNLNSALFGVVYNIWLSVNMTFISVNFNCVRLYDSVHSRTGAMESFTATESANGIETHVPLRKSRQAIEYGSRKIVRLLRLILGRLGSSAYSKFTKPL